MKRSTLICLGLTVAVAAVYLPGARFDFLTYDDSDYVTDNPRMQQGLTWSNVIWAFATRRTANWHPLTWLSLLLDRQLFGTWAGGFHLTNVLLHAVNTSLLFLVLQRLTAAPWRSAFVAALFGLHPLHVESVAWISERKDVLCGLFWFLAMWGYVRYVEQPGRARYWQTVGAHALALMSKPMAVTLPFALLLLDYWPLGRVRDPKADVPRLLREKAPLFALSAASSVVTFWIQRSMGAMSALEALPLSTRLANALVSYVEYIGKAIWPMKLAVFYPPRPPLPASSVLLAASVLAAISVAAVRMARSKPWMLTGWLWYVGTLAPVIGLVQVGAQAMADRYTYIPLIGLFLMLAWTAPASVLQRRSAQWIAGGLGAAILLTCAGRSRIQVSYWRDSETLFRHALRVTEGNWLAHNNLGVALKQAGKPRQEEMEQYREAIRLRPGYAEAHYNLGVALWESGERTAAVEHWKLAALAKPRYGDAYSNLGAALKQLGQLEEAIHYYERAAQLEPDRVAPPYAEALNDFGVALWRQGKREEAVRCYRQALRIKPDLAQAHYNLAGALEQQGRLDEAVLHYEQALRFRADFTEAQNRLTRLKAIREHPPTP